MNYKDYYKVLGVNNNSSDKDIQKAFRKLAKQYHPDANPNNSSAEKRFKEVNEAYEVLGNKEKRKKYDQLGAGWEQYQGQDFSDMFRGRKSHKMNFGSQGGDFDFSDFFEMFFGDSSDNFWNQHTQDGFTSSNTGRTSYRSQKRPTKGSDVNYTTEVTLQESLNGTKRRVQIQDKGKTRTIEVSIPPGVKDGSKVRITGKGRGEVGMRGDLFVLVKLKKHPFFISDGNDLYCEIMIPDYDAILGTETRVETLDSNVQMKIPAGTSTGKTFRLKGKGLPFLKSKKRGDIFVKIIVKTSTKLSNEEKKLIQKFKTLRRN